MNKTITNNGTLTISGAGTVTVTANWSAGTNAIDNLSTLSVSSPELTSGLIMKLCRNLMNDLC